MDCLLELTGMNQCFDFFRRQLFYRQDFRLIQVLL